MRACMDMDDRADTEVLSLTLKWCKKRLSDMRIDERYVLLAKYYGCRKSMVLYRC